MRPRWVPNLIVLLTALGHAWYLRWVAEDAYISLRYARNMLEGHGLVFNVGERVEGYTNFLWTLLLAAGLAADLEPEILSAALGMSFTAVTFLLLFRLHRRLSAERVVFPAGLAALALNYTWACYSTSGLETSLLCALLAGVFVTLVEWSDHDRGTARARALLGSAGALTALAMMTRPDAALVLPAALLLVAMRSRRRAAADALILLSALLVTYVPYYAWRFGYYGHPFPNTYYAKGAYLSYYGQGLVYLWQFTHRYFLWAFLPLLALGAWKGFRDLGVRSAPVWAISAYCLVHTLYVVRVGGDFMEGRFFVPILPFLYLMIEQSMRALFRRPIVLLPAFAVLLSSVAVDRKLIEPGKIESGIADERSWVPAFRLWYREGVTLARNLPPDTVVATDSVGAFGFASRLPVIDTLGLTDEYVAHLPLGKRQRPGHEKGAPPDYLASRNVAIVRDGIGMYRLEGGADFTHAGNEYYVLSADPAVIRGLHRAAVELKSRSLLQ